MSDDQPITKWIGALKEGAASNAEQGLWEAYFDRLIRLARSKMREMPTTVADEEDVALSAMNSFFSRIGKGQFPKLGDRTELWPLLVQTTVWKISNLRRGQFAECRDARKAVSLDWLKENSPNAEVAARVIEEGNALLDALTDEKLRSVAALKIEGFTNAEIAEKIDRTEGTVEWRLRQVRKHLQAAIDEENDS